MFFRKKYILKMNKKILIVCHCSLRGNSIGLIEEFLTQFDSLKKEGCQIDLFDTNYFQKHNPDDYKVDTYYKINIRLLDKLVQKIPGVRVKYLHHRILNLLDKILLKKKYDLVIMYSVPPYSDRAVALIHEHKVKVALYPWGSEVLRAKGEVALAVKIAHEKADFIAGHEGSNLLSNAYENFHVEKKKIKERKSFFKGVEMLQLERGKLSRKEMSSAIGIPYSNYNIICGYSGCETHMHRNIIDAIVRNIKVLPLGYQLIFPMTYVADKKYIRELQHLCSQNNINAIFITEYMTDKQVAYLHLLTDLYINIQPSDNGSAFMTEALYAGNQIITGGWLNYAQYEKYGVPYHLLNNIDELPLCLYKIFTKEIEPVVVPLDLKNAYEFPESYDKATIWREMLNEQ